MPRSRHTRRTEAEWREVFRRFESSALSPRVFCRREGVALSSFQRWRTRIAETTRGAEFVELTPASPPSAGWTLDLSLPNGVSIRVQG